MGTHVPNRHGKGSPGAGQFAAGGQPAPTGDSDTLTLDNAAVLVGSVADLYDKMTYDNDGFDGHGYNREGFNRVRLHRNGTRYDNDGFDSWGLNRTGGDRHGN